MAALASGTARAEEVTVQNDSLMGGDDGAIQAGFVAGESAAVWLTSPCDGSIVAVQVFWRSLAGGAAQSLEDSISIFDGGSFPTPGTLLEFLGGPVMTDGVINEFRFLDDNQTIPINVPVTNGQVFVLSFKFETSPSPFNGPSVVTDTNGCQSGKNGIFAIPGGWLNSCALGISGDFVIRAVVDCTSVGGACCPPDGICVDVPSSDDCTALGGTFQGPLTECASVTCPQPSGACCFDPTGCINLTAADCGTAGGVWQGPGTVCIAGDCPIGACCLPDGTCLPDQRPADCVGQGGVYQGDGVACVGGLCPVPQGACCFSNGNCLELSETDCAQAPNTAWSGPMTTCADANSNGTADECEAPSCGPVTRGDFDLSSVIDGDDASGFVSAYVTPAAPGTDAFCRADMNDDAILDNTDVDLFVQCLVNSACP
ncbi:MAG: hypothetical protein V3T70_11405 [Phycisphaerae bacterium]